MEEIRRDETGYYIGEWKGKRVRVPSVTTVLGLLADYSQVKPDLLKRACDFGTAVHSIVELYEKGTLDPESLKPHGIRLPDGNVTMTADMTPILNAWIKCKQDKGFTVHAVEEPICSLRHGYAGRPDAIAFLDGGVRILIEIKSRPYNSMLEPLQTAAYLEGWNEGNPGYKLTKRFFCELRLDGTYDWREIINKPTDHFQIFRSALALWQWRANLSKVL
jgi:hypothetical protein